MFLISVYVLFSIIFLMSLFLSIVLSTEHITRSHEYAQQSKGLTKSYLVMMNCVLIALKSQRASAVKSSVVVRDHRS